MSVKLVFFIESHGFDLIIFYTKMILVGYIQSVTKSLFKRIVMNPTSDIDARKMVKQVYFK